MQQDGRSNLDRHFNGGRRCLAKAQGCRLTKAQAAMVQDFPNVRDPIPALAKRLGTSPTPKVGLVVAIPVATGLVGKTFIFELEAILLGKC